MRALAWTRAAAHHAQLAKSISSICGSSREVRESKRTSPLSVELSGERSATPVQVARTRPQAGHAHAQMQGQMGEQPFSEKLERAGIRIRAAAHHLGRDCGAGQPITVMPMMSDMLTFAGAVEMRKKTHAPRVSHTQSAIVFAPAFATSARWASMMARSLEGWASASQLNSGPGGRLCDLQNISLRLIP